MIISKKTQVAIDFKPSINHNLIKQTDNLRYLGVYLDNKLSWKSHIDILRTKLSKICGIIYKLRHYVLLSTLKSVYQVHKYNTRQKFRNEYYQFYVGSESGKKSLQYICLNICRNIPQEYRHCSFTKFKKYFKIITLANKHHYFMVQLYLSNLSVLFC